jgi:spermidine synthase
VAGGEPGADLPDHETSPAQEQEAGALRRLLLVVALSGAAGLISEVAWSRALGQVVGGSLASQAIILGVFLTGLGAGAAIAGRLAARVRRPLPAYAGLETAIGTWAFFSPALIRLGAALIERIGPAAGDGAPVALLRAAVTALVLLPPTVAMGATLPILVRAWSDTDSRRGLPWLYGCNTVGAAVGALLGAFVCLPFLGTRLALATAAALNLVAATGALLLARGPVTRPATGHAPADRHEARTGRSDLPGLPLPALAFVSGIVGALFQFGWVRVMTLGFGSSIYALGLTLGGCLLGLGLGPLVAARRARQGDEAAARSAAATAAWCAATSSLAILPLLGALPRAAVPLSILFERSPLAALALQFSLAVLLMLLPAMAQGACLPLLAAAESGRATEARAAGRIYAASTWGSVAGFLLAGFVLVPRLGTRRMLLAAAVTALILSLALRPTLRPRRLLVLLAPLALIVLPAWDAALMSGGGFLYGPLYRAAFPASRLEPAVRRRGTLLLAREDGDALVTVRQSATGVLSLQINGKTEASSGADMATQLLASHLPLLLRPGARDVMIVGLASGVTAGAALRHEPRQVRVIEIGRAVPAAARVFDAVNGRALDDPRLSVVIDDARAWLLGRDLRFDVIASQPSNPWVAGVANLFTEEFYRLVRAHLRPGGIFCQWVQAYRMDPGDLRGVVRSFARVFPDATLWEESAGGGDLFLVGGIGGRLDAAALAAAPAAVWDDLRRAGIAGPTDLLARFVAGPGGLARFAGDAAPHTDDNLYLEWRAPLTLFRDTSRIQMELLRREREPVMALLDPKSAADPAFLSALGASLRRRDARIAAAADLRDADLVALREPHLAAGLDLLRVGRDAEAAAAVAPAAAAAPGSASAQWLLGEAYRGAGLTGPAAVAYARAVFLDPALAAAWNGLGLSRLAADRLDEAGAAFERALRVEPGSALTRNNLGTVLLRRGDLDGAEGAFEAALGVDPGLAAAHANLGLVAKRRGDTTTAARRYRQALDLDPSNTDARFNLAALLRDEGRVSEARVELESLLKIDPDDAGAQAALAALPGR